MPARSPAEDRELGYRRLIELGIALSAERNHDRLMEKILLGAKELTNADGGTLYLVSEDRTELRFAIMRNDTLEIALGGTTGAPIPFPPIPLRDADGSPTTSNVAAAAALTGDTINIADAYDVPGLRFQRPARLRCAHRLSLAIVSHRAAQEPRRRGRRRAAAHQCARADGKVDPVRRPKIVPLIEALASQAAVALDNQMLIDGAEAICSAPSSRSSPARSTPNRPIPAAIAGACPSSTNMLARAADAATEQARSPIST